MSTLILIGGGSASGKTTIAGMLSRRLAGCEAVALSLDRYYRDLGHLSQVEACAVNFDHPDSLDHQRLIRDVRALLAGDHVRLPRYDFITHTCQAETEVSPDAEVVLVEGIFALHFPELVRLASLRLFIDADADLRLARRLRRDVNERGLSADQVLSQYLSTVRPMHLAFIEPTRRNADVIIPGDREFAVAHKLVDAFVLGELANSSFMRRATRTRCEPVASPPTTA